MPKGVFPRRRKPLSERLAAFVARRGPDECWEWQGHRMRNGYGKMTWPTRTDKILAHRAAWIVANGPIPDGLSVCHRCDNRPCCNPAHLFLGTARDNTQDMVSKGRHFSLYRNATHCVNGHEFNEANTRINTKGNQRVCRACEAERREANRNHAA